MMLGHRSNKRPSSPSAARIAATAVTETLEGRCLMSGGAVLPGSLMPYLSVGSLLQLGRQQRAEAGAEPAAKGKAAAVLASASGTSSAGGVAAALVASSTIVPTGVTTRPTITGSFP